MRNHEQNQPAQDSYQYVEKLYRCMAIVSAVRRAIMGDYAESGNQLPPHMFDYVMCLEHAEDVFMTNIEPLQNIAETNTGAEAPRTGG